MIRKTPLKRSTKPIKRSAIKNRRTKPRPGRLEGDDLKLLRLAAYDRDRGRCVTCRCVVDPRLPVEDDRSFHLAHRRGKRMWGDHLNQVDTSCGKCHREFHERGPSREKIVPAKPKP